MHGNFDMVPCPKGRGLLTRMNIRKIERRIKNTQRYSERFRERNACPNCNSMDVAKRTTTKDYRCYNCKWVGKDIIKIMA